MSFVLLGPSAKYPIASVMAARARSLGALVRECRACAAAQGRSGTYVWGGQVDWATLAVAWLVACAIGLAIYFLPNSAAPG